MLLFCLLNTRMLVVAATSVTLILQYSLLYSELLNVMLRLDQFASLDAILIIITNHFPQIVFPRKALYLLFNLLLRNVVKWSDTL